jgi:hypothetical protein
MAFTPSLIGSATGNNVSSLTITVPTGGVAAGSKILMAVAVSAASGVNDPTDSAGNIYGDEGGATSGSISVGIFVVPSALALAHNNTIVLSASSGTFSGRIAAFAVSGLTSGVIAETSSGQGHSTLPDAALNNVPVNNWCVGIVGVGASSTNLFTQAPGFSNPGNLNTQITTSFSAYAGYLHATSGGQVVYAPTLLTAADWVAVLVSLSP